MIPPWFGSYAPGTQVEAVWVKKKFCRGLPAHIYIYTYDICIYTAASTSNIYLYMCMYIYMYTYTYTYSYTHSNTCLYMHMQLNPLCVHLESRLTSVLRDQSIPPSPISTTRHHRRLSSSGRLGTRMVKHRRHAHCCPKASS